MISITRAKELKGTLRLPPSPDLFFVSLVLALATGCRTRIDAVAQTPLVGLWCAWFKNRASIEFNAQSCDIIPAPDSSESLRLCYPDVPYPDITVFLLLAHDKTLELSALPPLIRAQWQRCAERAGCVLSVSAAGDVQTLTLEKTEYFHVPDATVDIDDVHPFLALAMGLKQPVECVVSQPWSSPLRSALAAFGFPCVVKSLVRKTDEDPLMRRFRFMKTGKKSEGPQQFTITVDFSKTPCAETRVDLPGDEMLAGLIIAAKCLIPKGSLVLENVGLESWNTQILQLVKNMGATLGMQEERVGTYGSAGSVVVQKIALFGRKVDCRPRYQFAAQLPAMVVVAAFAQGQSIFRSLDYLRNDDPDGIEQIYACIAALGARHGEMPDGIVMEGARQFDGFDLPQALPAHVAGAFAVAGLKCIGTTTVADEAIIRRWPDFGALLSSISEFKETT